MPFKKGQSGNPGGRPVGAMRESRKMLSMVINGRLPMSRRVDLLAKLAEGISMERVILSKDGKQKRIEVFQVAPDIDALKYLTDQADGKAVQRTEITGKDGNSIEVSTFEITIVNPKSKGNGHNGDGKTKN